MVTRPIDTRRFVLGGKGSGWIDRLYQFCRFRTSSRLEQARFHVAMISASVLVSFHSGCGDAFHAARTWSPSCRSWLFFDLEHLGRDLSSIWKGDRGAAVSSCRSIENGAATSSPLAAFLSGHLSLSSWYQRSGLCDVPSWRQLCVFFYTRLQWQEARYSITSGP